MDKPPVDNPYVGPRPFQREERDRFFGREREARDLLSLVMSERLVLFYAQSGAGKSSLINTRLLPGLEARGFEILPVGRVSGDLPPGLEAKDIFALNLMLKVDTGEDDPARFRGLRLAQFLTGLVVGENGAKYLPGGGSQAEETESAAVPADNAATPAEGEMPAEYVIPPRVLVIDQFEELFTTHLEAWRQREDFMLQLAEAMEADPYLWVTLAMREDYIAGLDPYAGLLPGGLKARYSMQRLGESAALDAVMKPVENLRPFDREAAANLVVNLSRIHAGRQADGTPIFVPGEYVEPVQLQVVCYQLWEALKSQPGERITQADINRLARGRDLAEFVNRALADFYSTAVRRVAAAPDLKITEEQLREWFANQMITEARTRGFVFMGEHTTGGIPNAAVTMLEGQLLRGENRAGGRWYELVHDRFIEPILQSNREYAMAQGRTPRLASLIGVGVLALVAVAFAVWAGLASRSALAHASQSTVSARTAMAANANAFQSEILVLTAQANSTQAEAVARAAWTAEAERRYGLQEATSTIQALGVASTAHAVEAQLLALQVGMLQSETPAPIIPTPLASSTLAASHTPEPPTPPRRTPTPYLTNTAGPSGTAGPTETPAPTETPTPTEEAASTETPVPIFTRPPGPAESATIQAATAAALMSQLDTLYATQTALAAPVRTIVYGQSVMGTPLWATQLGNGTRNIVLVGGLHNGFAPSTSALVGLVSDYFQDHMDEIPASVRLHLILNANPDSVAAPGLTEGRLNANGVDLNRNWNCDWSAQSTFRNQTISGGTAPFSEPETQALREYFDRTQPAAVVVWTARSPNGQVSPGGCGERSLFSESLAGIYGRVARYTVAPFQAYAVNGDITQWLDSQGIPAIFVTQTDYEKPDFDNNLRAIRALLELYGRR